MQKRRTKIIATLGPALDEPGKLEAAITAGASIFRANFSHGQAKGHQKRIEAVRNAAFAVNGEVTIIADLQGPKIRIAKFKEDKILLKESDKFIIDTSLDESAGDQSQVGCEYKALSDDVKVNDTLLLDDGRIVLMVDSINGKKINCQVVVGGELSNNKGINKKGGGLTAQTLTEKDREDLKSAVTFGVDYIALSFTHSAKDVLDAKKLLNDMSSNAGVIAKIECAEAVEAIDEIIEAADAVMVARGDLSIEIGDAEVPGVQKQIIQRARALNKVVITATQMMESMIHSNVPTRAEVSDVANAVLDGTDAIMLSAESAVGEYPIETIEAMDRVCKSAEKQHRATHSRHRVERQFERVDEAIAMAAMYTANHLSIKAIVSLTESGSTALLMSRIRSSMPIYALTRHVATQRRVNLYSGVYPLEFDMTKIPRQALNRVVADFLKTSGVLEEGDLIIITKGDVIGVHGFTNSMKLFHV